MEEYYLRNGLTLVKQCLENRLEMMQVGVLHGVGRQTVPVPC